MRKLTILLIAVIFVASIFIVGVFGLKALPVDERYPVKEINFVDYIDPDGTVHYIKYGGKELRTSEEDGKTIYTVRLYFEGTDTIEIPIEYNINPVNATNKNIDVKVLSCSADGCYELITDNVLFKAHRLKLKLLPDTGGSSVTLLLKAADGSGVSAEIRITAFKVS